MKDTTVPVIKSTTVYDMFFPLQGNRGVNRRHVHDIAESISKKNMLQYAPIIVSDTFFIIDGQHRLEAARQQQVPIYYITLPGSSLKEAQLLNAALRQWSLKDFVLAYVQQKNPEYQALLDFMEEYGVSASMASTLLEGKYLAGSHTAQVNKVKNGLFAVKNKKFAQETIENVLSFSIFLSEEKTAKTRDFISAIGMISRHISLKDLHDKLTETKTIIRRKSSRAEYVELLEEVYNRGEKTYIRFI